MLAKAIEELEKLCIDCGKNQHQYYEAVLKNQLIRLKEIYKDFWMQEEKWIRLAGGRDEDLIRRYAYEYVRAPQVDDRVKVWQLYNADYTQSKIAETLDMSRQWVHKILEYPLKSAFGRNFSSSGKPSSSTSFSQPAFQSRNSSARLNAIYNSNSRCKCQPYSRVSI